MEDDPNDQGTTTGGDRCHLCGGPVLPIVYGYPGPDLFDAAERGEVALGGCVLYDDQPRYRCMRCQPERASAAPVLPFRTVAEAYALRRPAPEAPTGELD